MTAGLTGTEVTAKERKEQYAICKQRGHAIRTEPNASTLSIYRPPEENPFAACKYCGTFFRYVTTMEETNVPK